MRLLRLALGLAALTGLLLPGQAWAKQQASSSLSRQDVSFLKKAARANLGEVQLGQLALRRATQGDVKELADRLVRDHSRGLDELKSLASDFSVSLPGSLPAEMRSLRDRLANLSGPRFDLSYTRAMVRDHTEDIRDFRAAARRVRNQQLRQWIVRTIPVLQEHLGMARNAVGVARLAVGHQRRATGLTGVRAGG